jgi:hypothetical protein
MCVCLSQLVMFVGVLPRLDPHTVYVSLVTQSALYSSVSGQVQELHVADCGLAGCCIACMFCPVLVTGGAMTIV